MKKLSIIFLSLFVIVVLLHSFSSCQENENRNFPSCDYSQVICYKLNGNGNHSYAESALRQQTSEFKQLSEDQVKAFLLLINDVNSYGNSVAACHNPEIGLVFYDEHKQPCSYLSVCLTCNNIYANPKIDLGLRAGLESGFSRESRDQLREIFKSWGYSNDAKSPMFDEKGDRE